MSVLILLMAVLLGVVAVSVLVAVAVVVMGTGGRPLVASAWRRVQATRAAGLVVGLVLAWRAFQGGSYGTGPMLAPAVLGLCVVIGVALGETVVRPRRASGTRSASLTPRRVRDYLPGVTSRLVAGVLALEVLTLAFTTVTASRDPDTGSMRALSCATSTTGSARTPYPGSYYSAPLMMMLLLVLFVAAVAAVQVVRRPRGLGAGDADDDALRRRSLEVVVAATGIAVAATYSGIAVFAGGAWLNLGNAGTGCAPGWAAPMGIALLLAAALALGVLAFCIAQLVGGHASLPATTSSPVAQSRRR